MQSYKVVKAHEAELTWFNLPIKKAILIGAGIFMLVVALIISFSWLVLAISILVFLGYIYIIFSVDISAKLFDSKLPEKIENDLY